MNEEYTPAQVEREIQQYWQETQAFKTREDLCTEKYYALAMLPYPSGHLHMGHVRNYTLVDVIAHYQRMLGKNVLHPIGWDAFGLPAENAAHQHGVHPAQWTDHNIQQMRQELKRLGFSYDWSRELATCDPQYYRWEQWFFLKLYERGLAYKKNTWVNWDPVDETVLANEQVIDGRGWRSGAPIERRAISQWFLKITDYADALLEGLDTLTHWPEQVCTMQKNWIGRCTGTEVIFQVAHTPTPLTVFTTRIDTLMGVSYIALAPEHPLVQHCAQQRPDVAKFCTEFQNTPLAEANIATLEKMGIDTGLMAIHPISGERLPIWVANFVLMDYGTGAVMSVPAHDHRDHEFAKKYHLPIKPVIRPQDGSTWDYHQKPFTEKGVLMHSLLFDGLTSDQAISAITSTLQDQGKGHSKTQYRLRDWGISRQRYWGTPIPMIHCPHCGLQPAPIDTLPVILPRSMPLQGKGNPLTQTPEFYQTSCPQCGGDACRETDTFDTFFESSWYYARYACHDQHEAMLDDRAKYWTPVDQYVGGIEHAVMHLLYARFIHKAMRDLGLVNSDEPFMNLLCQGMVLKDGAKMSKSKGNTVAPQPFIERYGADTIRLFIVFAAPCDQALEWSDRGVEGAHRFLKRLWKFVFLNQERLKNLDPNKAWLESSQRLRQIRTEMHRILHAAQQDFDKTQFNTVVSWSMKLFHCIQSIHNEDHALMSEGMHILLRLMAPITPHIAQKLWVTLNYGQDIFDSPWPKADRDALQADTVLMVIQINGKLRDHIELPVDVSPDQAKASALAAPKIQGYLNDTPPKKIIVVPNRLINIVL